MIKTLIRFFLLCFGVASIVFFSIRMIPGDPVDLLLGDLAPESAKEQLRNQLNLKDSLGNQFKTFWINLLHFDLGTSISKQEDNMTLIMKRFPASLELGIFSMALSILLSIPLGVIAAFHMGKFLDKLILSFSILGLSIPNFWLAPMLVLVFSVVLKIFPVSERVGPLSYVLPVLSLSLALISILIRVVRANILEHINKDYVRTALAKGKSPKNILYKDVLRNALIPIITVISLQLGVVLTGTIITETIFDWNGLGLLTFEAIKSRDYPLIQACVIVISLSYLFVNLLTDWIYVLVNPKLR